MTQVNMENLTKEARMTYISADFIEQTEEQLHAAETEIWENMDKMKDMSLVERFQFERGIYDKFVEWLIRFFPGK